MKDEYCVPLNDNLSVLWFLCALSLILMPFVLCLMKTKVKYQHILFSVRDLIKSEGQRQSTGNRYHWERCFILY